MRRIELAGTWLRRAASNLKLAQVGEIDDGICFEDLCFNAQQSAEKSLKAFCILKPFLFQKTHNLAYLIEVIINAGFIIPAEVRSVALLTDYSVETRYPGDYDEVSFEEYQEALTIAKDVYIWVENQIKSSDHES